jgi:hypothetical protein
LRDGRANTRRIIPRRPLDDTPTWEAGATGYEAMLRASPVLNGPRNPAGVCLCLEKTNQKESIFQRLDVSVGPIAQGPDVGESDRSVKYSFARPDFSRGSRSVPMYSARKLRSPSTFGESRDEPKKSAHNVIGSGFHCGRTGTSRVRLSGCFASHSGRTVMPSPSRANGRLIPGSLVTT